MDFNNGLWDTICYIGTGYGLNDLTVQYRAYEQRKAHPLEQPKGKANILGFELSVIQQSA
jgi:hypothetical protein